jgi:hypothetical protein
MREVISIHIGQAGVQTGAFVYVLFFISLFFSLASVACVMRDSRLVSVDFFFSVLADLFASPRSSPKTNDTGNSCWELYCLEVRFFSYQRDAGF